MWGNPSQLFSCPSLTNRMRPARCVTEEVIRRNAFSASLAIKGRSMIVAGDVASSLGVRSDWEGNRCRCVLTTAERALISV